MMKNIGFIFAGSGCQYPGMGRDLAQTSAPFSRALHECAEILDPWLPRPLLETVLHKGDETVLRTIEFMTAGIFSLQFALTQHWMDLGVRPMAVLTHSMGSYAAACASGAINLEEACALIKARCSIVPLREKPGGMALIETEANVVATMIEKLALQVEIAAVNTDNWTTCAGEKSHLSALVSRAAASGIRAKVHPISHAFHSSFMDAVLPPYAAASQKIGDRTPHIAFYTTTRSNRVELLDSDFWCEQIRGAMNFETAYIPFSSCGQQINLEIGPSDPFCRFAKCASEKHRLGDQNLASLSEHDPMVTRQAECLILKRNNDDA